MSTSRPRQATKLNGRAQQRTYHNRINAASIARMLALLCLCWMKPSMAMGQESNARSPIPLEVIEQKLWGEIYREGGSTFYCNKSFEKKSPLLAASYIYPTSAIREHLRCGTKRRCTKESAQYRSIASDLNNIVIADAYFEMQKSNKVFGILGNSVDANKCGIRSKLHVIEPPSQIAGDIARVILYMHERYDLPLLGNRTDLEAWNEADPPSEEERKRNEEIFKAQGFSNPLITHVNTEQFLSSR